MAQVRPSRQRWATGEQQANGSESRRSLSARLRVQDVPRPLMAALVALLALACLACFALWRTAGTETTYARHEEQIGSAASDAPDADEHESAQGSQTTTPASADVSTEVTTAEQHKQEPVTVDVDGAVVCPGVYELPEGARVKDAVTKAGGLAEDSDTTGVNLAQKLEDGQKVVIPRTGEHMTGVTVGSGAAVEAPGTQATLVNINTADIAELDSLPGVGESTARAIVEDREQNGPFTCPEDLMRVSGIGEKKFARLQALVCV